MTKPDDIKKEIASLKQHKRSVGNLMMTQVLMLVVIIVMLFTMDIRAVYAVGAVVLVYILLIVRPAKNRYTQRITALECLFGVGEALEECTYDHVGSIPRDILEQVRMVSPRKWDIDTVCRHSIRGETQGVKLLISEVSFGLPHGPRKGDVTFLSGTWIEAQLPKSTDLEVCCISRNIPKVSDMLPDLSSYGLTYVPFDNRKIRETAYSFTTGEDVPIWLEKQYSKLCGNGVPVMLSIRGDRVCIFLVSRFFAAKHKLSDQVTEQTVSFNRLPEKAAVLELIRIIQRNAVL